METESPYLSIEPHAIIIKLRANDDGGGHAQMVQIERCVDAVIDREDEGFVALSPVLDDSNVRWRYSRSISIHTSDLVETAMKTKTMGSTAWGLFG
ncbi:hypothetical protein AAC387_Pa11g0833 [Persea americana]